MDRRPSFSSADSTSPPKVLMILALVIAFSLPFIMVKNFSHKHKPISSKNQTDAVNLKAPSSAPRVVNPQLFSKLKKELESTKSNQAYGTAVSSNDGSSIKEPDKWEVIKTQPGDSFATVFKKQGISLHTLQTILQDNPENTSLTSLKSNQQLKLLIRNKTLEKMIIPLSTTQYLTVEREGQHYKSKLTTRKTQIRTRYITAALVGSLYNTAKHNDIPYKLIQQMSEIFTWDINFTKDARTGDQFTMLYEAFYIGEKLVKTGDILAVSYKNRGKTFQAIRHIDANGTSRYFTPQGKSLKKAFSRYPLHFSHISSPFSLARMHPILHNKRPHKGVDLAASIGTPIRATGDGRIEVIGNQSGYGNMIKIRHNLMYTTVYGHMLKFQKGLSRGDHVRRGQIIGYVGQTGLATGPHCHYEFHINQQAKNPSTVELPRESPISAKELSDFKVETNLLLAQLKHYEETHLASLKKKNTSA